MPMPPDVESYLRSLAHRFNEPDLRKAADEIEALRAELEKKEFLLGETLEQLRFEQAEAAEKGKRIEELEGALIEARKTTDLLLEHRHGWEKKQ